MGNLSRKETERREAFAAPQALLDRKDLGVKPGVLNRGSAERRKRGDEMLIVVRKSIGSHGHAHQHAEGIVFVTDWHG